jgi:hypothetical protein
VIPYTAGEPVVVRVDDGDADGIYTAPWGAIYTTPWGKVSPVTPEAIPGKPGHIKAGHLIFIGSDVVEELLASGKTIVIPEGLLAATTDGNRVFLHQWALNGHWVWVLHECVFDDDDQSDETPRTLLGVFPD